MAAADGYAAENAEDLTKAAWMEPLLENVRFILADIKRRMEKALALTQEDDGPQLYEKVIRSDLETMRDFLHVRIFFGFIGKSQG